MTQNKTKKTNKKPWLAGFKQTDIDLVKAADDLAIAEMKENFSDAVDDFCMSGGFDSPCVKAECEKSFTFSLPQIPDVVFDGRIDAILTQNDGSIKIVDYKTGRDKANTLEYAISEYGVNFKLRTGKDPSDVTTLQKRMTIKYLFIIWQAKTALNFLNTKTKYQSCPLFI